MAPMTSKVTSANVNSALMTRTPAVTAREGSRSYIPRGREGARAGSRRSAGLLAPAVRVRPPALVLDLRLLMTSVRLSPGSRVRNVLTLLLRRIRFLMQRSPQNVAKAGNHRLYATRRNTSDAFVPPKPNELDSATLISRFLG